MFAHACKLGLEGSAVEARGQSISERAEPELAKVPEPGVSAPMRENAHTLSDFRVPTLSIECERLEMNDEPPPRRTIIGAFPSGAEIVAFEPVEAAL